jgi:iron(III) transport system permease protein
MAITRRSFQWSGFTILTWMATLFTLIFVLQFIPPLFAEVGPMWSLVITYWFPEVIFETLVLVIGTALLASLIGVSLGYWMTFYQVRFQRLLDVMLVLPLAMPSYLLGYVYVHMTSVTGGLSQWLNAFFGFRGVSLTLTNLPSAIILFAITLYPYIYLATRAYLQKQPYTMFAAAKTLGASQTKVFWRIILPLLRPALIGSSVLVMMETLNDYGLVQYFGLRVFSTTIFQAWFNGNDLNTAVRLSVGLIVFILILLWAEASLRRAYKYGYPTTQIKPIPRLRFQLGNRIMFMMTATIVLLLALGLPLLQLLVWLPRVPARIYQTAFLDGILSSLLLAFYPTVIILMLAFAIVNFQRIFPSRNKKMLARFLTIGYSIPGAVIAVGMILMWIPFDRWFMETFGQPTMIVSGSIMLLIFGLVLRFLAVATNLLDGTYHRLGLKYTHASYALGQSKIRTLIQVDLPLISHGVLAAFLIVVIDLMKELPLTLILRPFNFQTLATYLYQYAGDEQINVAAPMALVLVLLTSLAVAFASDMMLKVNTYES